MKLKIITLATSAFLFTNCTTTNPFTGATQTSKTALGTGLGAVVGAGVGAIIGNNTGDGDSEKGALIGAGVGAGIGAGIGNYMDQQEAKIRQQLQSTGISVTRDGNNIILNMPENITFDVARSDLKPQFYPTLDSVTLVLNEFDKTTIAIAGHTDSDGSNSYNLNLSQNRANSVAAYLESKGVSEPRLNPIGYGEMHPVASNSNDAGKALNRRVELHIQPIESQFQ